MNHVKRKIVALLPIKGHSERVQGKNFRNLCGKPLYQWILDTLLSISEIDLVVINTDARDLFAACGTFNSQRVLIRDRDPSICGDFVSMNFVIENDIKAVAADVYLMTHATNPLLSAETITRALQRFRDDHQQGLADSLFTVNCIQSRFYRADGSPVNHDPLTLCRTQDLEPWFEENSNLYIFTAESFSKTQARIGLHPAMFTTPLIESVDIDHQESWTMAEHLLLGRQQAFGLNPIIMARMGEKAVEFSGDQTTANT